MAFPHSLWVHGTGQVCSFDSLRGESLSQYPLRVRGDHGQQGSVLPVVSSLSEG